jgi:hypothetical protein
MLHSKDFSSLASPTPSVGEVGLAATPNLNLDTGGGLRPTSIAGDTTDEGAFGIIQVQTLGDIGDLPRREDELAR